LCISVKGAAAAVYPLVPGECMVDGDERVAMPFKSAT
jgi:hypothetical protein